METSHEVEDEESQQDETSEDPRFKSIVTPPPNFVLPQARGSSLIKEFTSTIDDDTYQTANDKSKLVGSDNTGKRRVRLSHEKRQEIYNKRRG